MVNASILPSLYSNTPLPQLAGWGSIVYDTRSPIKLILAQSMAVQWYVHGIVETQVLSLTFELPGAILQEDDTRYTQQECCKTAFVTFSPIPGLLDPQFCHQLNISGIIWDGKFVDYEFGRTRGAFTATAERYVSGHHTELV
ncbi:hypothetical protein TNCV_547911 [Trichonephila clavipes]|nr:hypothetical protein TNCV_547911 [Trichonephila clavipes]